ncbi:unnamed protein product [Effrenium voratum]|nr:unnamed protein product [Effrenium voratum]
MAVDGRKAHRRSPLLYVLGGILTCTVTSHVFVICSRRAAVATVGSALAGAGPSIALARPELNQDQENCLSDCVYKCSGGARGKGAEYKDRVDCIAECKDKCLGKEEEGELILN